MRIIRLVLLVFTVTVTTAHAIIGHEGPFPLPGLSEAEMAAYVEGADIFCSHLSAQQGLGPVFNGNSCYSCHRRPLIGGLGNGPLVTRFGYTDGQTFDPLTSRGGSVLQAKAFPPECAETLPPEANVISRRRTPSVMGAGLIEAIPDDQIFAQAMAELAANPASAGRVHMVTGVSDGLPHVGRFGWKSQTALVIDFIGGAMRDELGVTNDLFPTENAPNGDAALLAQCDLAPDPEDTTGMLYKIYDVLKFIGPPPLPRRITPVITYGEQLFDTVGCTSCHYAGYTAVSSHPVLDGKPVALYSDLLLHDIGTGDGIVQGDAQGNEFRTAPLWLVRTGRPYLHDGRAATLTIAIDMHQNQALSVRNAYFALPPADQRAIQQFLKAR